MTRRGLTLLTGLVVAVALTVAAALSTVPYVALSPGPAINTLSAVGGEDVLSITGAKTYPTDGSLALTTVSVRDQLTLFEALKGWLSRREAVVPREILFPPDQSSAQREQANVQQMKQSQDDATTAALRELGYAESTRVVVSTISNGTPADGKLMTGDVLRSVDGTAVTDSASVGSLVRRHSPGEQVTIGVLRDDKPVVVVITTAASTDTPVRAIIGITPAESSTFAVKVDIRLRDIGGPSAGLMFALGIIDKLGPGSLTGGRSIAGTGEITADGKVGPIGGIAEKMIGARDKGATVFLSPAANCLEAKATKPSGITLVRVDTLRTALSALTTLESGGTPPSC